MRLNKQQEELFPQIDGVLLKMKFGEVRKIKTEHKNYNDFMSICKFIRENNWDTKDGYYLIISEGEIRKETLDTYNYICNLENALNKKEFNK